MRRARLPLEHHNPEQLRVFLRLALVLAAFAAAAYGPTLNLPFVGDDYVFLDKTRDASFADLWSRGNTDFGWYRPWSREFHFWVLQRLTGLHEAAFRSAGLMLWVAALCLYAATVRRLASTRVAMLATLGAATLALWGAPLLWISGSQDLWMLCFAMASLFMFVSGHTLWAAVPLGLALLSKETAAVLPALLCGYLVLLEHDRPMQALRRTAHLWVLVAIWLISHPTLHARLVSSPLSEEVKHRPDLVTILAKTILSAINLDAIPRPQEVGWGDVLLLLVSVLIIAVGLSTAARERAAYESVKSTGKESGPLARFALFWMTIGWLPLFLPSIAWHAYYGCLGVLGAWMALALWLESRPKVAVTLITCLAILRGAQANTQSWDWGNEWYQRRAGRMLSSIRDDMLRQHPTLPPHSRVFLGHLPNNIGLVAGQSPALRIWYRDPTLVAGFYSYYRLRTESDTSGKDFFFRFDSLRGMVEVRAGPEDVRQGIISNPEWEGDHEKLAMLFLRSGDVPRAAFEFEKLSALPRRADAVVYAAVCRQVAGDSTRADSLIVEASARMGVPREQVRDWVTNLRESLPAAEPRPTPPRPRRNPRPGSRRARGTRARLRGRTGGRPRRG